jgi:hypothetical protein
VSKQGRVVEVERDDGFVVDVAPADDAEPRKPFDAKAWWANLERLHEEIRAYRMANPDAEITESSVEILRELRESR